MATMEQFGIIHGIILLLCTIMLGGLARWSYLYIPWEIIPEYFLKKDPEPETRRYIKILNIKDQEYLIDPLVYSHIEELEKTIARIYTCDICYGNKFHWQWDKIHTQYVRRTCKKCTPDE